MCNFLWKFELEAGFPPCRRNSKELAALLADLSEVAESLSKTMNRHMAKEEAEVLPVLMRMLCVSEQRYIVWQVLRAMPLRLLERVMPWVAGGLLPLLPAALGGMVLAVEGGCGLALGDVVLVAVWLVVLLPLLLPLLVCLIGPVQVTSPCCPTRMLNPCSTTHTHHLQASCGRRTSRSGW